VGINQTDAEDQTPLGIAWIKGDLTIVKLLLNNDRIDLDRWKKEEWTPFYVACEKAQIKVIKLLMTDDRVDMTKPNKDGITSLEIARNKGHSAIVELLEQRLSTPSASIQESSRQKIAQVLPRADAESKMDEVKTIAKFLKKK
jgi:ankyrin repeat protein